jgi:hypothetical protein
MSKKPTLSPNQHRHDFAELNVWDEEEHPWSPTKSIYTLNNEIQNRFIIPWARFRFEAFFTPEIFDDELKSQTKSNAESAKNKRA